MGGFSGAFFFAGCCFPSLPRKVSLNYQLLFPGVTLTLSVFLWVQPDGDHFRLPLEEGGRIILSCHHSEFFDSLMVIISFSSAWGTAGCSFIFSYHSVFPSPSHNCSSGLDPGRRSFLVYEETLVWWISNAKHTYIAGAWGVGNLYSWPSVPELCLRYSSR